MNETDLILNTPMAALITAIFFQMIPNELQGAAAMTQGPFVQMSTPVLAGLKGNYAQLWHIQMAGAMITSIPPDYLCPAWPIFCDRIDCGNVERITDGVGLRPYRWEPARGDADARELRSLHIHPQSFGDVRGVATVRRQFAKPTLYAWNDIRTFWGVQEMP